MIWFILRKQCHLYTVFLISYFSYFFISQEPDTFKYFVNYIWKIGFLTHIARILLICLFSYLENHSHECLVLCRERKPRIVYWNTYSFTVYISKKKWQGCKLEGRRDLCLSIYTYVCIYKYMYMYRDISYKICDMYICINVYVHICLIIHLPFTHNWCLILYILFILQYIISYLSETNMSYLIK